MRAMTTLDAVEAAMVEGNAARAAVGRAREAADYPRARVARGAEGLWTIRIFHTPLYSYLLPVLTARKIDGFGTVGGTKSLTFATQQAAMQHARHEVHALKARRHPAGQPWLRGEDQ